MNPVGRHIKDWFETSDILVFPWNLAIQLLIHSCSLYFYKVSLIWFGSQQPRPQSTDEEESRVAAFSYCESSTNPDPFRFSLSPTSSSGTLLILPFGMLSYSQRSDTAENKVTRLCWDCETVRLSAVNFCQSLHRAMPASSAAFLLADYIPRLMSEKNGHGLLLVNEHLFKTPWVSYWKKCKTGSYVVY